MQGIDTTFGRGILDIARAFAPAGTLSLAGSMVAIPDEDSAGVTSGAMGDAAAGQGPLNVVSLDAYGRAYEVNLAHGLRGATPRLRLTPALASSGHNVGAKFGSLNLAFSLSERSPQPKALNLTSAQVTGARILAGRISASIARDTRFSLGMRQAAASQVIALQNLSSGNYLIAGNARFENGFDMLPKASFALRRQVAGNGVTLSVEAGEARLYERADSRYLTNGSKRYPYSNIGIAFDRAIGNAKTSLGGSYVREDETILGARFAQAIGRSGAQSFFVDATAQLDLDHNWTFGASWRQGWTKPGKTATLRGGTLSSNAFSLDIGKVGVLGRQDRFGFRIAQPLRVGSGGLQLELPVAYDYATLGTTYGTRTINLAPSGREIITEMSWATPVEIIPNQFGQFSTNLFWRQEPGHFKTSSDDFGMAFRFTAGF